MEFFVGTRFFETDPSKAKASLEKLVQFIDSALYAGVSSVYVAVNSDKDVSGALSLELDAELAKIVIFPVTPWGRFVQPLNAILGMAQGDIAKGMNFLSASVEVQLTDEIVDTLVDHMDMQTLVVGAVLQGHDYKGERVIHEATGCQVPWNTLSMWNSEFLYRGGGFPMIGDGLPGDPSTAGVEEVTTISMVQQRFPHLEAKLVKLTGDSSWDTSSFTGDRLAKHLAKMASKEQRPAAQLRWAGLVPPRVIHLY
ncbi:MAG: hypothetical protein CO029_04075 [Candidatus Magasanikbacteria bacterium CG_4_9_14_0_2_um_filter_41_10]|uniref:Uncharacterized protein n=1 Tax=Candidatus Magasanikbacteria bacterium CG_4_10_14_0_2_um_filter_41_31 TaxID=1974639 RepID=A0A2M7V5Z7_9BACT|nr:MAG: hypothetical protein AUJ37_03465 [Candidatus Magasanikbacteria bacterium CG1_02_41_34]PIZ94048.1 MAG: hypothetical protein COX83_00245 [Candidatus Magasanikbacteria bacterium CG_4_10_14_0_2_um_filter_41_31]PJC53176.1 MAG: hypothetical protein CO029_04075 [Candidatus Magasanikbacteria bacterium CG_4_9_14_0_2_um_filter_41_10]